MAEKKSKMAEKIGQSGGGKILKHGHYDYERNKHMWSNLTFNQHELTYSHKPFLSCFT